MTECGLNINHAKNDDYASGLKNGATSNAEGNAGYEDILKLEV
jgi:hypothetical protein